VGSWQKFLDVLSALSMYQDAYRQIQEAIAQDIREVIDQQIFDDLLSEIKSIMEPEWYDIEDYLAGGSDDQT
jgi:hypothetical protein